MKIILLHGDDYQKSYDRLQIFINSARERGWKIENFGPSDKISDILVAQSLFGEKKLYLLSEAEKLKKPEIEWMKKSLSEIDGTLVFYSRKTVNKTTIKSLPKLHKIEEYKLPKIIWSFLDSLYPGNARNTLKLFHQLIEHEPVELIFTFIARHARDMYFLKVSNDSLDYPSWRKGKLISQMRKYDEGGLERFIRKLSEVDLKVKTSNANLSELLDYIIVTELE